MPITMNIFGANRYWPHTKCRAGCRGIVERDGKILVSWERFTDQLFLPGGGLEKGESLRDCVVREIREETGVLVEPERHFLTLNEYYGEYLWISHFFVCRYLGEGEQDLTPEEAERGLVPLWIDTEELYKAFGRYEEYHEEKRGAYLRELTALKMYRTLP